MFIKIIFDGNLLWDTIAIAPNIEGSKMRKTILKTKRLKLTIAQESDIEPLYKGCFSDWEVQKLLLGRTFTLEETREYYEFDATDMLLKKS